MTSPTADIVIDPSFGVDDADSSCGDNLSPSTASLSSTIFQYRKLHGRTYHNFDGGEREYWAPNDAKQNEQLDINHHILSLALEDKLFLAPLTNPQEVLDIGTGTGIWAMDFADAFPGASVTGTDLSPIQPSWTPPNCKFELDDATKPWPYSDNSLDYVHVRYMIGCFADWPALYREAYRVLKPGGWLEHMECSSGVFSDDGTVPAEGGPFAEWRAVFHEAGKKMNQSFELLDDDQYIKWMEEAGFKGVQSRNTKVPVGEWPRDKRLKEIGYCNQLQLLSGLDGFGTYVLTNVLGWELAEAEALLARVKGALRNKSHHGYCVWGTAWVQKPLE
ncbi:S-adenosyl-L-methionine-dependent methyltransferase [Schizothecium vesticola]|uniref:S-adenosyl-L-methionine-dependent methyltransferase n=1 Tax=Schizothecium vesticola TaxID=314040 RepID=A0AA40F4B2_9PEZI|nr:S-adenosyl-L-methionine-dependent methyltransferase [Schizothecium vesticola]